MAKLFSLWFGLLRRLAAFALNRIPTDRPHGTLLFNAIVRHTWCVTIEAVSLRRRDGKVEVFLTKRSPHEAYADQWHCPGTWMRSMDAAIGDAFQRLWKREFRVPFRSPPVYCGMYFNRQEVRGQVLMLAYLVDLLEHVGGSLIGQWWPVDALPENTLAVHRDVTIPQAVAAFLAAGK